MSIISGFHLICLDDLLTAVPLELVLLLNPLVELSKSVLLPVSLLSFRSFFLLFDSCVLVCVVVSVEQLLSFVSFELLLLNVQDLD